MGISEIIEQRRKAKGMTQTELAKKSRGVTQGMISLIEKGDDNATLKTLRGIAAGLECATVDLLPEEDKCPQKPY